MESTKKTALSLAAVGAAALALVVGCNSPAGAIKTENADTSASLTAEAAPSAAAATLGDSCPMSVEGAAIEVSDTADGVAMTFTCAEGNVPGLRARAARMGDLYAMHDGHRTMMWHPMHGRASGGTMMGHGPGGMGGPGMGHGPGGMAPGGGMMPMVSRTVEDVDAGARVTLVPRDPSQLEATRAQVRAHVERMRSGECPMLQP